MYSIEEFDVQKSKIMKYIIFKKRTENEVRNKFSQTVESKLLNDIIDHLKEVGYLDDKMYVEKAVNEFKLLKNLSIKEIKYKLYTKGLNRNLIDEYIDENIDELVEYEKKSAQKLALKKTTVLTPEEISLYLINKGYKKNSIDLALEEL